MKRELTPHERDITHRAKRYLRRALELGLGLMQDREKFEELTDTERRLIAEEIREYEKRMRKVIRL